MTINTDIREQVRQRANINAHALFGGNVYGQF